MTLVTFVTICYVKGVLCRYPFQDTFTGPALVAGKPIEYCSLPQTYQCAKAHQVTKP